MPDLTQSMRSQFLSVAAVAALGLGLAAKTANAGLIGSMSVPASTYNVSTGTIDWIAHKGDGTLATKNTTNVLAIAGYFNGGVWNFGTTTTWSDGTPPNASGSSPNVIYPDIGHRYFGYVVTAPDPGAGKTYELKVLLGCIQDGGGYGPMTVTASVSGGGGSYSQVLPSGDALRLFTFDYSGGDLTISQSINYMWRPMFQFATLSDITVPEPATLLLVGVGALGGFGLIRRRSVKIT